MLVQEMEVLRHQKSVAEGRALQMSMALRESTEEGRRAREQLLCQEQNMIKAQEDARRKQAEWEVSTRAEMEKENADIKRELTECRAENKAISRCLAERTQSLSQLNHQKVLAETQNRLLQVRIEALEKDTTTSQYELHLLNKQLRLCSEEKDQLKKASVSAQNQHLEDVKKIAKLESECQRLRALLRKKLPGPATLTQMRVEADHMGKKKLPARRSTDAMTTSSTHKQTKEMETLNAEMAATEDKIKLLKEAMLKKSAELQTARELYAGTAAKLSSAEGLLKKIGCTLPADEASVTITPRSEQSITMIIPEVMDWAISSEDGGNNDDERSCAESWASALITELSYLKNDEHKPVPAPPEQLVIPEASWAEEAASKEIVDESNNNMITSRSSKDVLKKILKIFKLIEGAEQNLQLVLGDKLEQSSEEEASRILATLQNVISCYNGGKTEELPDRSFADAMAALKKENQEMEVRLQALLTELEQNRAELEEQRAQLSFTKKQLNEVSSLHEQAQKELVSAHADVDTIQQQVSSLTCELDTQARQRVELQEMVAKLSEPIKCCRSTDGDANPRKEFDVAAKGPLGPCQCSILVLGSQLKALTSTQEPTDASSATFSTSNSAFLRPGGATLNSVDHLSELSGHMSDLDRLYQHRSLHETTLHRCATSYRREPPEYSVMHSPLHEYIADIAASCGGYSPAYTNVSSPPASPLRIQTQPKRASEHPKSASSTATARSNACTKAAGSRSAVSLIAKFFGGSRKSPSAQ